jgi:hypothetical protein
VRAALRQLADPRRAKTSAWFFKTGPGEYGAGDRFLGIRVPDQRRVARNFRQLKLPEIAKLLRSRIHDERFTALEILVAQYETADAPLQERCASGSSPENSPRASYHPNVIWPAVPAERLSAMAD